MIKTALSLAALAGAGVTLAACGGVPGNAVATVDGEPIEKSEFSYYMKVLTKASGKTADKELRNQVVQLLVSYRWIEGEAKAQDVAVSDAEVRKSFDEQKKQQFPTDAAYKTFLKTSGQTEPELVKRVKSQLLSNKIRDKVVQGKDTVSQEAIEDFYNQNKARFAQPETRDLRVVVKKNKGAADKAYAALKAGAPWSKVDGSKLPAQTKDALDPALGDAVFSADKNELEGPVKTGSGYYVFSVTGIAEGGRQTLAEAKETITQALRSQNQQKALETFVTDFTKRWRDKTECSEGYRTSDCRNGPKPTPIPTPTAAATSEK